MLFSHLIPHSCHRVHCLGDRAQSTYMIPLTRPVDICVCSCVVYTVCVCVRVFVCIHCWSVCGWRVMFPYERANTGTNIECTCKKKVQVGCTIAGSRGADPHILGHGELRDEQPGWDFVQMLHDLSIIDVRYRFTQLTQRCVKNRRKIDIFTTKSSRKLCIFTGIHLLHYGNDRGHSSPCFVQITRSLKLSPQSCMQTPLLTRHQSYYCYTMWYLKYQGIVDHKRYKKIFRPFLSPQNSLIQVMMINLCPLVPHVCDAESLV